jgi:hypothetical protein
LRALQGIPPRQKPTKREIPYRTAAQNEDAKEFFNKLLEVGDPLSGTLAPPIYNPFNKFTYHMQELAFFSWFYGAPSVGVNGWFSDNDTFSTDAGPVCQ